MTSFYQSNAKNLYKQSTASFTSPLRQSLIEHKPFDNEKHFRANERFNTQSKFLDTDNYVNGLQNDAIKLKSSIREDKNQKHNRWPYVGGPPDVSKVITSEPKPVFERLSRDVEKRQKAKERESNIEFTYRDNVVVKKDIYVEYDYFGTLRSNKPGEKDERFKQFSPMGRRKQEEM